MTDSPDASAAMHGRVLALAGIAQALAQVRRLADPRQANQEKLRACLD